MTSPGVWRANVRRMYVWRALTMMHFFAGALVPFFTDWGGLTLPQLFLLQGWFFLWIFLLEVPTGAVADKYGRKTSIVCATACLIAATALYATGKGLARFLLAELIWAASAALASGADEAMVYDSLKAAGDEKESKKALSRLATFDIGAIALAAPLGSLMAAGWGLRAPMFAMLFPFSLGLLAALTLKEPPTGEAPEAKPGYSEVLTRGVRYFRGHKALRALAFDSVTIWMLSFMTVWLFQPRLKELGVGVAAYGFVTAAMTLSQIAVLNLGDRVEKFFGGTRRYLVWSAVIPGLAFLLLPFARHPLAASGLFVLIAGFGLSRSVVISNYMNKHIDGPMRATVLSMVGMSRQLTGIVVLPLTGLLTKASLGATFAVLGALILGCAWASSVEEAHLSDA
ncbi:MAG: MFS transporter [Elusimicrobiota bacterium]|nr:MAG: MFS transporter [Elusimicrobiota bacterium]